MFIYNCNNNNNNYKHSTKKGYKTAQRKQSRRSIGRGIKDSTALKRKSAKRKQLKKQNIQFLKQLGFQVKKK